MKTSQLTALSLFLVVGTTACPQETTRKDKVDPAQVQKEKEKANRAAEALGKKVVEATEANATATVTDVAAQVTFPEWVTAGSKSLAEGEKKVIFGVGTVRGIKNPALARVTADNRARSEVAKQVQALKEGKEPKVVAQTLTGVEIVDHFVDPKDGAIYALARYEMKSEAAKVEPAKAEPAKAPKK